MRFFATIVLAAVAFSAQAEWYLCGASIDDNNIPSSVANGGVIGEPLDLTEWINDPREKFEIDFNTVEADDMVAVELAFPFTHPKSGTERTQYVRLVGPICELDTGALMVRLGSNTMHQVELTYCNTACDE